MVLVMFTSYCFVFNSLQTLCFICVTILASNDFVFIILQTLFEKIPGVGYTHATVRVSFHPHSLRFRELRASPYV
jgi:hypothetical protein